MQLKVLGIQLHEKVTPAQVFSWEFCEIFKNTYFAEHLRRAVFEFFSEQVFWWDLQMSLDSFLTFDRVALLMASQKLTRKMASQKLTRKSFIYKVSL